MSARRLILVLADGLRPDAITAARMPSLYALAQAFTAATDARTIRPSATVAALASLATGVTPQSHRPLSPGVRFLPRLARLRPLARELARCGVPADVVTAELPAATLPVTWALAAAAGARRPVPAGRRARDNAAIGRLSAQVEEALLVVVADHGGGGVIGTEHHHPHPVNERIPLVLAGPGVAREHRLEGPISLLDVSATVLWWFGAPVPKSDEGRPLLEAFAPSLVLEAVG